MTTKSDDAKAAIEAEYKKKLADLARTEKIKARLPTIEGMPVYMVHNFKNTEPWISYKASNLESVWAVVEAYAARLVPYRDARADGCRRLAPFALLEPKYKKGAGAEEFGGPILRFNAYGGESSHSSADFEFWAKMRGLGIVKVSIGSDFTHGGGAFGFYASCRRDASGRVVRGSWQPPKEPTCDEVTKWGTGSDDNAQWSLRWRTLVGFRAVIGEIISKRLKWAQEARERATADYVARRNEPEMRARCRFVLDTLNRPAVRGLLRKDDMGPDFWTLANLRSVGYTAISKAVNSAAPEVFKVGIHDFLNTVYYLSKDTDNYDSAVDYRDDLRSVFEIVAKEAR